MFCVPSSHSLVRLGELLSGGPGSAPEYHKPFRYVLVYRLTDDLVLSLQMVDTVLFVGEFSSAFGAFERVLLVALVLEVPVQVVVPVVGALTVGTGEYPLRAIRLFLDGLWLCFALLLLPGQEGLTVNG